MYLGGHKLLKVLFSSRKKRHKLLNFGTLTIENSTCPPKYLSAPLGHHRSLGCLWPPLAASGRLWPPLAASGRLWPLLAASGRPWPPKSSFFPPEKETQVVEFRHLDHCKHCHC